MKMTGQSRRTLLNTLTSINESQQDLIISGKNRLERRIIKKKIRQGKKPTPIQASSDQSTNTKGLTNG